MRKCLSVLVLAAIAPMAWGQAPVPGQPSLTISGSTYSFTPPPGSPVTMQWGNYWVGFYWGGPGPNPIPPGPTATSFTAVSGTGAIGATVTLTATLNPPIAGKIIAFSLDGMSVGTATTNAAGLTSLASVPCAKPIGTFAGVVGVSFAGDATYAASSGKGDLTITGAPVPPWIPPGPPPFPSPTPMSSLGEWEWRNLEWAPGWRGYGRDVQGSFLISRWERIAH